MRTSARGPGPSASPDPPRIALTLLSLFLPKAEREHVLGDMIEEYTVRWRGGPGSAKRWFWRQSTIFFAFFAFDRLRELPERMTSRLLEHPSPPSGSKPRRENPMATLLKDLRHAFRLFARQPGFTGAVVLTLGLGIGANTAIFSVVNGVLLRPLPYEDPEELVLFRADLWELVGNPGIALGEAKDFGEMGQTLESVGSVAREQRMMLTGDPPVPVTVARVTANLFGILGVEPVIGRAFNDDDFATGSRPPLAILSDRIWEERFERDPGAIGQSLEVNGRLFTVVGVMEPGFSIHLDPASGVGTQIDLWAPMELTPTRNFWGFRSIGRLADGATLAQAQSEVDVLSAQFVEADPGTYDGLNIRHRIQPLHGDLVRNVRPSILALLGAVGLVLLIACVNGAGLILARTAGRESELAVRAAMGAGRSRIIRQVLTESLLLSVVSGVLGLVIGFIGLRALLALQPGDLPRIDAIRLDRWVLAFTFVVAGLASLLSGIVPALRASRPQLFDLMKSGAARGGGGRHGWVHRSLVISEVAFSLMLLVGTGLLIRTFVGLRAVDLGFATESVLTFEVPVNPAQFTSPEERWLFFDQLRDQISTTPGVIAVGGISDLPLGPSIPLKAPFATLERPELISETNADHRYVVPGYFEAMGIDVVEGRGFESVDNTEQRSVVVIDETLAEIAWPGESVVGRTLQMNLGTNFPDTSAEIVGVVRSTRVTTVRDVSIPQLYLPYWAQGGTATSMTVRTASLVPQSLLTDVHDYAMQLGSNWPVREVHAMETYVDRATAGDRFTLVLMAALGGLALALSAVGIYSVIAYLVSRRRREIGLRMALGADRRSILGLNLREGVLMAAIGVPIGLAGAFLLSGFIERLLFGVAPTDLATYVASPLALVGIAILASYLPARRAAKVDPMTALRID